MRELERLAVEVEREIGGVAEAAAFWRACSSAILELIAPDIRY